MCDGRGRGSRTSRSSNFAISFDFQSSRWTCQVPRAKAVMGIKAWCLLARKRFGGPGEAIHTENYETRTVFSTCSDEIRWIVNYGHEIGVISWLLCSLPGRL